MTKHEKELEHEKQTLMMMSRVSRHADVQRIINSQEANDWGQGIYYLLAACAGSFITLGVQMLIQWI